MLRGERALDKMLEIFPDAREASNGWYNTECPAHEDSNASFGFHLNERDFIQVKCLAGCTEDEIWKALDNPLGSVIGSGKSKSSTGKAKAQVSLFDVDQQLDASPARKKANKTASKSKKPVQWYTPATLAPYASIPIPETAEVTGTTVYTYKHPGVPELEFNRIRVDFQHDGKSDKTLCPYHRIAGGEWERGAPPKPTNVFPYKLGELLEVKDPQLHTLWVVEGEKCVEVLWARGCYATCLPIAAAALDPTYFKTLGLLPVFKEYICWPDNDDVGFGLMKKVGNYLNADGRTGIYALDIPSVSKQLDKGDDCCDWFAAGKTMADAIKLKREMGVEDPTVAAAKEQADDPALTSQAKKLLTIASELPIELRAVGNGSEFALMCAGNFVKPDTNSYLEARVCNTYYAQGGSTIRRSTWSNVRRHLEMAALEKPPISPALQFGHAVNDNTELFAHALGKSRCAVISKYSVTLVDEAPMQLIPQCEMRRLEPIADPVIPESGGGGLRLLLDIFPNLTEEDVIRAVYWMAITLFPDGHSVLLIKGDPCTGKTQLGRALRYILTGDGGYPSMLDKATIGKTDIRPELYHNAIVYWDNLSYVGEQMSDFLCQVVTGTELASRKLYSDNESTGSVIKRSIILTSTSLSYSREDLLSRTVSIATKERGSFTPFPSEHEWWKEVHKQAPLIVGALYRCLQEALNQPPIELPGGISRIARTAGLAARVAAIGLERTEDDVRNVLASGADEAKSAFIDENDVYKELRHAMGVTAARQFDMHRERTGWATETKTTTEWAQFLAEKGTGLLDRKKLEPCALGKRLMHLRSLGVNPLVKLSVVADGKHATRWTISIYLGKSETNGAHTEARSYTPSLAVQQGTKLISQLTEMFGAEVVEQVEQEDFSHLSLDD